MATYLINMFKNVRNNVQTYFNSTNLNENENTELIKDELPKGITNARFVIERVLSENIKVGIMNKGANLIDEEFIPIKHTSQGLQYKDQYYHLIQFKDEGSKLSYDFRGLFSTDRVTLELILKSPDIYYSLHNYNTTFESGYIDNMIRKTHKTIKLESKEIDHISELFNKI